MEALSLPITETWLKEMGFRWHQVDRQPTRHWVLWLGGIIDGGIFSPVEDLGIELAIEWTQGAYWFCWLRADVAHRYCRFIHVRHLHLRHEVIDLIEALTGHAFVPENNIYGAIHSADVARGIREREQRMDRVIMHETRWSEIEGDDSRGAALPEHYEAFERGKS